MTRMVFSSLLCTGLWLMNPPAAQASLLSYSTAPEFARFNSLKISPAGKVLASEGWDAKTDVDGTDLLTSKSANAHAAILRSEAGEMEIFISYAMKAKVESDTAVFFAKNTHGTALAAVTSCEDSGDKDSLGRICVTATPKLCQGLRAGEGVDGAALKEMETYETKALASILTLRGADHQLDNVVTSGNRLGLRSALQTTKGQLTALARQVSKELGQLPAETDVANGETAADKQKAAARASAENLLAKNVLEKSLPRLKENCLAGKF